MFILTKLMNIFKYNIPNRSNRLNFFFNTIKLLISLVSIVIILFLILSINASMLKLKFVFSIVFVGVPGILGAIIATRCAVYRLHDLSLSGWWLVAMICPQKNGNQFDCNSRQYGSCFCFNFKRASLVSIRESFNCLPI